MLTADAAGITEVIHGDPGIHGDDDELLAERRRQRIAWVAAWLRRQDCVEVLSQTRYNVGGGNRGPDHAFDAAAAEADLERAVGLLRDPLERVAATASRRYGRAAGWRASISTQLVIRCPGAWAAWLGMQRRATFGRDQKEEAIDSLIRRAASRMVDDHLGEGYW